MLESHLSFPVLSYYRSQHDNQSWLAALTTILDTCALILAAAPGKCVFRSQSSFAMQPATVHELLLRNSDGTYEPVVWNERLNGVDEVTVRLGRVCSTVKIYDPTIGTRPVQTRDKVDVLKLTLSDHPLILAITEK